MPSSSVVSRQPRPPERQGQVPLRCGDRLGRYIITGYAGTGATSYVYQARAEDGGATVAVKVLHAHLVADPDKRLQFYREARVMMRVQHPNVVRFLDIVEEQGELAFVMEYIHGQTLDRWQRTHGEEVDEATLACLFVDILRGLGSAHRLGVVHRDLKPANILITYEDERFVAKIIDFGVARFLDQPLGEDEAQKIVGTAAYISPEEVVDPTRVCEASDLYSIGVMLYEAACGRRPFDGMAVRDLLRAHASEEPERPRQLNPQMSRGLESVILRTLNKRPDERFRTAPEMIRALELAIEGAMELPAPALESCVVDSALTTEWHRAIYLAHASRPRRAPMGLVRRMLEAAFVLFTHTGVTGRTDDPHYLNRPPTSHLPFV